MSDLRGHGKMCTTVLFSPAAIVCTADPALESMQSCFEGAPSTRRVYPTVHDRGSLFSPAHGENSRIAPEFLIGLSDCGFQIAD